MGQKFVPNPNFFFFGIVRSPFVMGVNGNTEFNKLSPFRSIMEINLNVGGPNGDTLVESTSFTATTHDLFTGDRPRRTTLNPYMPHLLGRRSGRLRFCHAWDSGKHYKQQPTFRALGSERPLSRHGTGFLPFRVKAIAR